MLATTQAQHLSPTRRPISESHLQARLAELPAGYHTQQHDLHLPGALLEKAVEVILTYKATKGVTELAQCELAKDAGHLGVIPL